MTFYNRLRTIAALLSLFLSIHASAQKSKISPAQPALYQQKMQSSALLFMENKGQIADDKSNPQPHILYTASSGGAKIYLTATCIHYQFSKTDYPKGYDPFSKELGKDPQTEAALRKQIKTSTHRFTVELQGANPNATVTKQNQSSYYENYYLPQCPNGITGVHGYEKITFKNVYPSIDWVVYSEGGFMEYDFLVHPGGNPASIKLKIKDADNVSLTPQGELLMKTSLGEVKEKAPESFASGQKVASHFKQNTDGTIGFAVQPQPSKELRIDPSIVWSTYYGGSENETGRACSIDAGGNVYLAGPTESTNNIAAPGNQTALNGISDGFILKFDRTGSRLWATYYGGSNSDGFFDLITDPCNQDIFYAVGVTRSTNVIAYNGFQNVFGGNSDAFITRFTSTGSRVWSSYYGGNQVDGARSCTIDRSGNIFMSGVTYGSTSNIAFNGFQNTYGGGFADAYLVKMSSAGARIWATYYGGNDYDEGHDCCTDSTGSVYICGSTNSSAGIASNGFQNAFAGGYSPGDAYLAKFDSNGNRIWSTYYGGNSYDYGSGCCTDLNGNVFLTGHSYSANNIAANGFINTLIGISDGFLAKFNSAGARIWGTYCGGSTGTNLAYIPNSCINDYNGNIFFVGSTFSSGGLASGGIQSVNNGNKDCYVIKFDPGGARLWSTYFGGNLHDESINCAIDHIGNLYFCGSTLSTANLSYNGVQNTFGGGTYEGDAFLSKIKDVDTCISPRISEIKSDVDTISCPIFTAKLSITCAALNSAYQWQWHKDSCNGPTVGTGFTITVSPTTTTTYYVRGEGGCVAPGNCASKRIITGSIVLPTVVLTASPSGTISSGTMVTFTAIPTNGGISPLFTFKVNGVTVQNGTSNVFTSSTLANRDTVIVELSSNASCANPAPVTSNAINIVVAVPCIAPTTPTISTNYDTVCTGATPTLTIASGNLNSATRWQWYTDSCGGTPVGNTTSITLTPTLTTTYYVRGEGGCVTPGNCVSKTIYVKPKPVVTFTATPAILCPADTATVLFTGTAPASATYSWNWGGGTVISGTGAGPYKVVYNSANAIDLTVNNGTCSIAATQQTISILPKPTASFEMSDTIGCGQLSLLLYNKSVNATSWYWSFGDNAVSTDSAQPPHLYSKGFYTISLKATNSNCSHTTTQILRVVDKPVAGFVATPGANTSISLQQANFSFRNTSTNANKYVWQFGDLSTSSLTNPSHQYLKTGSYTVKLLAYSSPLCVDSFELKPIIILADTIAPFTIPNAFSPNGDGVNDKWMVAALQQSANCRVTVYNRWGQTVFTSMGYNKPWDGNFNGRALPVDTYYYVIIVENKSYNGSIVLLR